MVQISGMVSNYPVDFFNILLAAWTDHDHLGAPLK